MIEMLIEPGLQRAVDTAIKNSDGDTAEEIVERRHDLSPEIKLAFEALIHVINEIRDKGKEKEKINTRLVQG